MASEALLPPVEDPDQFSACSRATGTVPWAAFGVKRARMARAMKEDLERFLQGTRKNLQAAAK
jgi:hypothetical protein